MTFEAPGQHLGSSPFYEQEVQAALGVYGGPGGAGGLVEDGAHGEDGVLGGGGGLGAPASAIIGSRASE